MSQQQFKRQADAKLADELRQIAAILDAQKPLLSVVGNDDLVRDGASRSVLPDTVAND